VSFTDGGGADTQGKDWWKYLLAGVPKPFSPRGGEKKIAGQPGENKVTTETLKKRKKVCRRKTTNKHPPHQRGGSAKNHVNLVRRGGGVDIQ